MIVQTPLGIVEYAVTGEGPAVLAIRGAMGGYEQGLLLAHAAIGSPDYRVVSVSRPGYLATPLASGEAPERQADLCAALLDALSIRHAVVIAVSGGGPCALQFALRHPNRCRGLVMVSACSAQLTVKIPFQFQVMKLVARIPWLVAAMRKRAAPPRNDPAAGALLLELRLTTMDHMARRLPGTDNDIFQTRLPFHYPVESIAVPALIIHGTADEVVPFTQSVSLAARLPHAELLAIEGGEHVALFTHLHEVRAGVGRFLGELPGSA